MSTPAETITIELPRAVTSALFPVLMRELGIVAESERHAARLRDPQSLNASRLQRTAVHALWAALGAADPDGCPRPRRRAKVPA